MKAWEVVKAMMENPNLKFKHVKESEDVFKHIEVTSNVICWGGNQKYPLKIVTDLEIEWERAQEPVDFMTAVNSGKNFKPESWIWCNENVDKFRSLYDNLEMFTGRSGVQTKILNGKWYVED